MVPEGWSQVELQDLAVIERGKFSARPRNDPKYYGGEMPFVQTGDVAAANTYLYDYSQSLNSLGVGVSKVFPAGTIFVTIAANIGETAITTFEAACPDSVVAIQPYPEKADVFWLKMYMETLRNSLDDKATQNAQKNINLQVLKPLKIAAPPYVEQRKIAKILSTWDEAIATTERLLANSEQQKKALMQQFLTGKKRLPGFDGEWREVVLGDLANVSKGKALSGKDLMEGQYPVVAGGKRSPYTHDAYTHENAITVSASGAYAGYVTYHVYKFWASDCSVVEESDQADIRFLEQLLTWSQNRIYALQSGGAQPHVYPKDLKLMRFSVPSIGEQKAIAKVLVACAEAENILACEIEVLKQEKKALMQQLLTGKRRVKVDAEDTETASA